MAGKSYRYKVIAPCFIDDSYREPDNSASPSPKSIITKDEKLDPVPKCLELIEDKAPAADADAIDATDAALDLAMEHDIDLANVEGTGKDGRIGKGDVQKVLDAEVI